MIGAGIVGASVAFRLAGSGAAQVWIVDRSGPGSGTTSASFAWVNANDKTPRDYFELNHAGLEEHLQLRDELPDEAPWLHSGGNLEWAGDEETLEALVNRVERLRSWGYAVEWREARHVNEVLEPNVAFPSPDTPVAFFPEEAWVDAPQLAHAFVGLACQKGAETRFGVAVKEIETDGGRVSALLLRGGERLPVDAVVNAAGPGADKVLRCWDARCRSGRRRDCSYAFQWKRMSSAGSCIPRRSTCAPMVRSASWCITVRLIRSSKTTGRRRTPSVRSCWSVPGGWSQRSKARRSRTCGSVSAQCLKTACPAWERFRNSVATTRPLLTVA